jgi:hypothetical protein
LVLSGDVFKRVAGPDFIRRFQQVMPVRIDHRAGQPVEQLDELPCFRGAQLRLIVPLRQLQVRFDQAACVGLVAC